MTRPQPGTGSYGTSGSGPTGRRRLLPGLSLRTWLLGSHLLVLALPLLALVGTGALAMDLRRQTRADLEHQADVLTVAVAALARSDSGAPLGVDELGPQLVPLLQTIRQRTLAGIRVVDGDGLVVASSASVSAATAGPPEDLSSDPVVAEALAGRVGVDTRPRSRQSERQPLDGPSRRARVRLFVAKPIRVGDEVAGAVLFSRTPREELQALYQMSPRLIWGLLAALVVTVALAVFAGRLATRSLASLAEAARRLTHGSGSEGAKLLRSAGSHVDEVRELATATAAMAEQLQSRVDYINEFAGNVAHEFRTPIATLRGTAELLRDDEQMPADRRQRFLDNALEELERLERLVDGLLALARAEQPHAGAQVDLAALLAELPQRWPDLELDQPQLASAVEGSHSQLASVLDNLIDNAFAHGGPEVHVRVRGLSDPATRRTGFEVEDDGPGISPGNRDRIFDRFFTTKREEGGTGLGLALVRRVVSTHGGEIEVESAAGCTRVRVWLDADAT
ncbi:two-component sensor histidine kinase [Pseudenhygromyxa sp. WMMC2535]|uniref:sensor histidine kinase n=1 Tax=Pseudenhygromyxa sp. WMMC2535 TaxID=2712867 RepID=UPI0015534E29|nr:ATP-binding protein [Pseudenhygromyxa sp. WMMC2535]NVB41345.1 two-component sensor histidine kinase [Pseudenhygromyxa sp. WMMC2535]